MITPVCGTDDDTAAIQAAIDTGLPVQLPPGPCRISASLNMTNRQGAMLVGCGIMATQIIPIVSGINAIIDLTGSSNATLRDLRIFGYGDLTKVSKIGILSAQAADSYNSDATLIERVRVDGAFSLAAWFNLGVASSACAWSQFYNYQPGAMTTIFTGNNFFGAASDRTAIDNSNTHVPSDWTLFQTETHNMGNAAALWIGGAQSCRWYGGNISSSALCVDNNAVTIGGANAYPQYNLFDGTTFYNDNAPAPAFAIKNNCPPAYAPTLRNNFCPFPLLG